LEKIFLEKAQIKVPVLSAEAGLLPTFRDIVTDNTSALNFTACSLGTTAIDIHMRD